MKESDQICADCGSREPPVMKNRGVGWAEVLLWLFYLLPGLIYSLWRRARRLLVCSYCGNPSMISVHSGRARKMKQLMKGHEVSSSLYKKPLGVTELKPKTLRNMRKSKQRKSRGGHS